MRSAGQRVLDIQEDLTTKSKGVRGRWAREELPRVTPRQNGTLHKVQVEVEDDANSH